MNQTPRPFKRSGVAGAALLLSLLLVPAVAADSMRVGGYDFSYSATGDGAARPIQVFDDGQSTFMQFRPGMAVPAIFTNGAGTPQLLVPTLEGPYVKLSSVHGSLLLQMGRARAQVVHAGGGRADALELAVTAPAGREPYVPGAPYPQGAQLVASIAPVPMSMTGTPAVVDDRLVTNSYATPRKGDAVAWQERAQTAKVEKEVWFVSGSAALPPAARNYVAGFAKLVPTGGRVVVIGREDESFKEGIEAARAKLMKDILVKAGVPSERVSERSGVSGNRDGRLWASTVVIESDLEAAPTRTSNAILDNLQNLVRLNVLRLDQAEAIARGHGTSMTASAAPVQAAAPRGAPTAASAGAAASGTAWDMRKVDVTVEAMLARWAASTEPKWRVVYAKDAPRIEINGDSRIPAGDFLTAADYVVRSAQSSGWSISASAYSNNTLVIAKK